MTLDFATASAGLIINSYIMIPTYLFLVWITLGNGMRFGLAYLIAGSILCQAFLWLVFVSSPRWSSDVELAFTLALTALVVPAFSYSLLRAKQKAEQETAQIAAARARLLAQASHDLRQPLHAMQLFVGDLRQTLLTQYQVAVVSRLERAVGNIDSLFTTLLDITAIYSGSVKPHLEVMAVQPVFDALRELFPDQLRLRFVPTGLHVLSDPVLLRTILQNLISNAIKYAPDSGVVVGCKRQDGRISLVVADRGPGIEDIHLRHVFEEFYQIRRDGDADRSGIGLGLAVVDQFTKLLGLQAELRSRLGHGTVAFVHGLETASPSASDGKPTAARITSPLIGLRVILVEDDPDLLESTRDLLTSWGCEVQAFASLPENPRECDVIITDFDLGRGATGADVIDRVRAASGVDVPAIILTGHDRKPLVASMDGKRQYVLKKPVTRAQLRSAIAMVRL
ncbi:hybrid sensor histidine kinase/response regulator [Porphyrobacter sp. CACIAM 03H1]|uniref:hybrid sensor histidine kinase/response regulator n=1 Tax=Porphyrobacter sp. CACIAM 03H1 TaxID=2003315 RepID=UPI00155F6A09|nr:hybrid sensor histidine kinase/response regulator [Porphyrobacter sp. CACIAM 03H1]